MGKQTAQKGSAAPWWRAENNQGRKGLAASAPLLDCAVEFLKLPGSICVHDKTPAKSWQEVSRRFPVETCARLCKTKPAFIDAQSPHRPTCPADIRLPADGGSAPALLHCKEGTHPTEYSCPRRPRWRAPSLIPETFSHKPTSGPSLFCTHPASPGLAPT